MLNEKDPMYNGSAKPSVLLVDDQPARLLSYETILAKLEVHCVRAQSGQEALQRLLKEEFAVVLLDVSMPDMDGFEVARLLREHPRLERTPIIFVTGVHVNELDHLKGYEVGGIDYIQVPVVPEILRSKVAVLVELHQRSRELQALNHALKEARDRLDAERTQELARQRQMYEAILTNTPDLAYVFDLQHRFIYANEALLKMWGKTAGDAVGKTCLELGYEPWHAAMHDREIDAVIETKSAVRGEVPFTGTFGRRDYDYLFVPVLDGQGEVVAIAGTTRDITERKQLEASLRESSRRKDEFIAMLAHELRNPVAPIRAAAEALTRSALESSASSLASIIKRQSDQLARLLDDLLDVARITQGRIDLKPAVVTIDGCIQSAVEATKSIIADKQLTLKVTSPSAPVRVKADAIRITQCVTNLLVNASKFTPAGGMICIRTHAQGGKAVVEVEDNGIGIEADLLPHVFDMFVQRTPTPDRALGGLGIGLTLCKRIMEMHGGDISAASEGPGRGARFTLSLPLAEAFEGETSKSTDRAVEGAVPGRRVLIVDDNQDAADSLAALLELEGHTPMVAYSPEEAVEHVIQNPPEIAILDIGLPRVSGYELARQIRDLRASVRLIALSGYGLPEDKKRSAEAGFDVHLVKPIDSAALKIVVDRMNS